jgi:hypothetical protein
MLRGERRVRELTALGKREGRLENRVSSAMVKFWDIVKDLLNADRSQTRHVLSH